LSIPAAIPTSVHLPHNPNELSTIAEGSNDSLATPEEETEEDPEGAPEGDPQELPEGEGAGNNEPTDEPDDAAWDDNAWNDEPQQPNSPTRRTRAGRRVGRGNPRYIEQYMTTIVAYESITEPIDSNSWLDDPLEAYAASADPDVMYLDEAMKQPDHKQFKDAMTKEITDHIEKEFWSLFPKANLAANTKIIPMVWAMRQKRRIATREIYKWKAILNVDGSKNRRTTQAKRTHLWQRGRKSDYV
jgi:hypothetical protein